MGGISDHSGFYRVANILATRECYVNVTFDGRKRWNTFKNLDNEIADQLNFLVLNKMSNFMAEDGLGINHTIHEWNPPSILY